MAIKTRSSRLAVTTETTEGTPVYPSAASGYLSIQDDFSMDPAFDTLENAELRASIGKSKPILGLEQPQASFSHYLRHSGVEGQAPNYGVSLLKAVFGAEDVEGDEYDTVNSSTTSVIKVNTGEGADYRRGQPLLIKDSANGYAIRPVDSISGDNLTIGFNLDTAPASGVNLGKAITYYPADEGHPTLTLWHYLGNGGAIQVMAGSRVTSFSATFDAGELINASYSLEGSAFYFDALNVTSSNKYLDFNVGASELNASIAEKLYKDPHDLASALQTAMNGLTSGVTVTYSNSTGKFTIAKASGTLNLLWDTGTNNANTIGSLLGFSVAANDTGSLSYTSDDPVSYESPQTPSFDDSDPLAAKDNLVFIGDSDDNVCFEPSSVTVNIDTPATPILSVCEESGKSGSIINEREVTVEVSALLKDYDADQWYRFRTNQDTKFLYNFGIKSGGNWVAGKCGMVYLPSAVISAFKIDDNDGLAVVNFTLSAFVDSDGNGEVYLGFV